MTDRSVTLREMFTSLESPDRIDGWLVAFAVISVLFAMGTLVLVGYAIGVGGRGVPAALVVVSASLFTLVQTGLALHRRALNARPHASHGGSNDVVDQFRRLLRRD